MGITFGIDIYNIKLLRACSLYISNKRLFYKLRMYFVLWSNVVLLLLLFFSSIVKFNKYFLYKLLVHELFDSKLML